MSQQDGFTIVESLIALGLVFGVLVGLLASLNIGVRGVVTGRQRSVAVSIANEVMETARSRSYAEVGHDLDSDPTLAADPAITGSIPDLFYTGLGPDADEPLAASAVDAGPDAESTSNPLFPFSPHRWERVREGTTYDVSVYVTSVVPASGDPYRRLTVVVTWDRNLQPSGRTGSVRLSSYLFDAVRPPDPLLVGLAEADAGNVTVTGFLSGIDLSDARVWLPFVHGEIESRFVRRTTGFARTARSLMNLRSGSATGCTASSAGLTAECSGVKVETASDNDAATAPPEHNVNGPLSDPGGTVAAGGVLQSIIGSGTARSLSTARSCWSCYGPGLDDDDRLPYHRGEAAGPDTLTLPFSTGPVVGSLLTSTGPCSTCSAVTLDRDDIGDVPRLSTTAAANHPAIDVVTIDGAPDGYAGMVRVGPTSVTTSATSGPGALAPSTTGDPVAVELFDTTISPAYRSFPITPGTPSETTSHAEMTISDARVVMDATVQSGPAVTLSTSGPDGAVTEAQASLSNWLSVDVHLVVTDSAGAVLADLVVSVDYGRVTSRATYQPAPP